MTRAPDWTEQEFEILLDSQKTAADLATDLPGRTQDAIEVVRQGVHSFHMSANTSMLSQLMIRFLERRRGGLVCPVCKRSF